MKHLSIVALGILLTGCASAPTAGPTTTGNSPAGGLPPIPANTQVTITFENYNLASAGIGREATMKMIDSFMKQYPNIKVETKATPSTEIMASARAQIVAGNPPDLFQGLLREWDVVVENITPVPLEEIASTDELKAHFAGVYPFHPKAIALTQREGKTYGLPYVFSTPTLFYNADIFRAAGLDPNKPPTTWAEVKTAGLVIKEKTGKGGIYVHCIELDWCTQAIHLSNGGSVLSPDRKTIKFGEKETIESMAMWQDLVKSGVHITQSGSEATDSFNAGNLAMFLQTSAVQGSILTASKDKWELKSTGMPSFGNKQVQPTNSGSGLAILSNDPVKKRAAWELMKWLTNEEAFTIITSEIGYLPLRTGIVNDDRFLKAWVTKNPQILPNLEQLDGLQPSVSFPGDNQVQIRNIYLRAIQDVLLAGTDPATTMTEAAKRSQELMPRR